MHGVMDRAAHLLLVARSRRAAAPAAGVVPTQHQRFLSESTAVARSIGDRTHDAARVLRRRAIAPGRPRTFMIRPVMSYSSESTRAFSYTSLSSPCFTYGNTNWSSTIAASKNATIVSRSAATSLDDFAERRIASGCFARRAARSAWLK